MDLTVYDHLISFKVLLKTVHFLSELFTHLTFLSHSKVSNPDTTHIEVKMLENGYPFGAIINKNMMNDDYQRTNWPVLFNYGVAENEMKWRSCCNKDQAVQVLGFSRS